VIHGIDEAGAHPDVTVFHAGTATNSDDNIVTSGGRVLGVTAVGSDLSAAIDLAYTAAGKIHWPGMQMRRDIGK
jgi:phosphoribosylamine--glycine ligase